MATLVDPGFPTLANVLSRLKPEGGVETKLAEVLNKKLEWLDDVPFIQGNMETGHRMTERTGLPSPTWRRLNEGIDPGKSTTAQYDETCGMLEAMSRVDSALAEMSGDAAAFRASEDKAFIEGFTQEVARSIFYENAATSPERIHGLAARYAATSGYKASPYVYKPGTNAGSNCRSVWLINWGEDTVFGIYPKHSTAGLSMKDMGEDYVRDANGREFLALRSHFKWRLGLGVKDYRQVVRLQYDPDDAAGGFTNAGKGLILALQDMLTIVHELSPGARFYMGRDTKRLLDNQLANNQQNLLEYVAMGGKRVATFMGTPIRDRVDALVDEQALA